MFILNSHFSAFILYNFFFGRFLFFKVMLLSTNIDKKIIARIDEKFHCSIDLWVGTIEKILITHGRYTYKRHHVPFILGLTNYEVS